MINLSVQELQHLEKLANIKINDNETSTFLNKLDNIIDKLHELDKIDTSWINDLTVWNTLRCIPGNKDFENKQWILSNAKHEIINNSIVIKSSISN